MSRGEVVDIFTGSRITPESVSRDYTRAMTSILVPGLGDMGLETEYMAILGRHLEDLHIGTLVGDKRNSRLAVIKDEETCRYVRIANMTDTEIEKYSNTLQCASRRVLGNELDQGLSKRLALDWLFIELSMDALANVYDMQRRFGKYVFDYDGQSPHYESQFAISRDFLGKYGQEGFNKSEVAADHLAFRRGIALHFMKDFLLGADVVDSQAVSNRFVNELCKIYPKPDDEDTKIKPMSEALLYERFIFMTPRNTRAQLASFVLANYGPEDMDLDESIDLD